MFELSPHIDKNKIFLVNLSEIEGVLSPLFFKSKPIPLKYNQKLKKIANINPIRNKPVFNDKDLVPYVGLPETDEHTREITSIVLRPYKEVKGRNIIYPNDILFARIEPSIFNQKYIFAGDLKGYDFAFTSTEFYIIEQKSIDIKYIFHLLFSDYIFNQIKGKTTGSTGRRRLDLEAFKNIEVPVIDEYKQIIDLYETAYQTKQQKEAKAEQLLNNIDDYLLGELGITLPEKDNSLENRMFKVNFSEITGERFDCDYYQIYYKNLEKSIENCTFDVIQIKDVVSFIGSGKTPASTDYSDTPTDFPIIKAGSYTDEFIDLNKVDYTTIKPTIYAKKGDIFILSAAHQAEYVGKQIKYLDDIPEQKTSFVGELICIRANTLTINSVYLFSLLNLNIYKTLLNREKTGQTSHIYAKDIKNIFIPKPRIEKQNEIAEHIKEIREQAKQLKSEAKEVLEQAKQEVEKMILGK